jgi:multidrug efflux pump subunit AcrA (membrane-fusion protein)
MKKIEIAMILTLAAAVTLSPGCRRGAAPVEAEPDHKEETHAPGTLHLSAEAQADGGILVSEVKKSVLSGRMSFPGELVFNGRRLAEVTARVSGRIERMPVVSGDSVKQGQTLAEIYSREFLAVQAEVLQAAERAARLSGDPDHSSAEAFLLAARKKLLPFGWEEKDIDTLIASGAPCPLLSVRAPFAGTIIEAPALPGSQVEAGARLFRLADLSSLWAHVHIYEKNLAGLQTGTPIIIRTQAFPGREFPGRLVLIGAVMDEETRTVEGRVEVANADRSLRAGMYIDAAMPSGESRTAVVIPASALQEFQSHPVVFVRTDPETFMLRPVETGAREGGLIEITQGLSAGEWVVTAGGFLMKSELLKSSLVDEHGHD